jgi:hypothetical protein
MPMRVRIVVFAVCLALAVSGTALTPAPATAATGDASTVFTLTNAQRTKAGLKPLVSDAALDKAAQAWAQQLADSCTFAHSTSSWRAARVATAGWSATGENIAAGHTSASAVVTAWMGSAGHKANILHKGYTGLGVGVARGTCYGLYWVQIFGWSKTAGSPGVGDLDDDFDSDVLALTGDGELVAYRGNGAGGWQGTTTLDSYYWQPDDRLVTLGDFSGDGISDLGRISSDGRFDLFKGTGGGTFAAPVSIGSGWGGLTAVVGGLDYTGDGRTDVLGRTSTGLLYLYRGNGAGGFLAGSTKIGSGWNGMTAILYAGDFNGDTRGDVMARRTDGTLWLYPSTGASTWGATKQIGKGWNGMDAVFSPGDFDGSGKPDVIARKTDGTLMLYRGNGKGGWGAITVIGSGWGAMRQVG